MYNESNIIVLIGYILQLFQSKAAGNSHHKWIKRCSKNLVSALKKKKLRIGDALHEDLLAWLSATMEQCSDVSDDITKLVIHQSSLNQIGRASCRERV